MFAKIIAALIVLYSIKTGNYVNILWAVVLWEVGSGFKMTSVFWLSNIGRDKDDNHGP